MAALLLEKRGYLNKQSDHLKTWNVRYFSLENSILFYYKGINDKTSRGSIYLGGCTVAMAGERTSASGTFYTFTIQHPSERKVYRLSTESEKECNDWVSTLQRAVLLAKEDSARVRGQDQETLSRRTSARTIPMNASPSQGSHSSTPSSTPAAGATAEGASSSSLMSTSTSRAGATSRDVVASPSTGAAPAAPSSPSAAPSPIAMSTSVPSKAVPSAAPVQSPSPATSLAPSAESTAPQLPSLSPTHPYAAELEEARRVILEADEHTSCEPAKYPWKLIRPAGEEGVVVYQKEVSSASGPGSANCVLGRGTVHAPPRILWEYVLSMDKRKEWDSMFRNGHVVQHLDANSEVVNLRFAAVWPTKARDSCNVSHWWQSPDGTYGLVGRSVEHANCPEDPSFVRMNLVAGGFIIHPVPGKPNMSSVVYMVHTDLKGSIPAFVINAVSIKQPLIVATLDQLFQSKRMEYMPSSEGAAQAGRGATGASSTATAVTAGANASGETHPGEGSHATSQPATGRSAQTHNTPASSQLTLRRTPTAPQARIQWHVVGVTLGLVLFMWDSVSGLVTTALQLWVAYLLLDAFLLYAIYIPGGDRMSTRRKLMLATWDAPKEGNITGVLHIDATKLLAYIQQVRKDTNVHVTVTHMALKAIGVALGKYPNLNGRIVSGRYVPATNVDIGCLVALHGGKDLANAKIIDADKSSVVQIAQQLEMAANKLRQGKDEDFEKSKPMLQSLPVFVLRPLVHLTGYLASALGFEIPALGVRPFPFGSVLVTSVGSLGLDEAFAPFTPWTHTPILLLVGAIKNAPVVVNDSVVVQPQLTVTATIDHRLLDGSQGAMLVKEIRMVLENPDLLDK